MKKDLRWILGLIVMVTISLFSSLPSGTFGQTLKPPVEEVIAIPKKVLTLIRDEKTITEKKVIYHEWRKGTIYIVTGHVNGPLDGQGYEFGAEKTS
ncbi:MAG: hypothetical protein ACO1TE_29515 [Prosthecobacter sp.]